MTEFHFPKSIRIYSIFGIIISVIFVGYAFTVFQKLEETSTFNMFFIPFIGVSFIFVLYFLNFLKKRNDSIKINDDEISYQSSPKAPVIIKWKNVSNVNSHEFLRHLSITDMICNCRMKIPYEIEKFDQLRNFILNKTQHVLKGASFQSRYYKKITFYFFPIIMLALGGIMLTSSSVLENILYSLFAAGLIVFGIVIFITEEKFLRIQSDKLILDYLFWKTEIDVSEILDVSIYNKKFSTTEFVTIKVIIKRKEPVEIVGFRGSSIDIFNAIKQVAKT